MNNLKNNNYTVEEHSKINSYNIADVNKEVRDYLNKFDLSINPFINKEVEEKDFSKVNIYSTKDYAGSYLIIEEKDSSNKTVYAENKDGFNFKVEYNKGINEASATHYIKNGKEMFDVIDSGLETKYNLTDKKVIQNKTVYDLNEKNILSMCKSLNYLTALASTITIDNMDKVKSLVIK